jgi:hypothetical protein
MREESESDTLSILLQQRRLWPLAPRRETTGHLN